MSHLQLDLPGSTVVAALLRGSRSPEAPPSLAAGSLPQAGSVVRRAKAASAREARLCHAPSQSLVGAVPEEDTVFPLTQTLQGLLGYSGPSPRCLACNGPASC